MIVFVVSGTILRNKIAQEYVLVVRTTPQLIVEIAMHKQRMLGKYTPESLASEFNTKIRSVEGTEKDEITSSLVDQAITVWNRCLSISENMTTVMANVNTYGHTTVFNGVGLFQAIVSKGSTSPNIKWLIQDLDDQFRNKIIPSKGLGLRDMQGAKQKVSWPQKSLFKMNVLKYLREDWLEVQACDAQFKVKLREITASHANWRKAMGYQDEAVYIFFAKCFCYGLAFCFVLLFTTGWAKQNIENRIRFLETPQVECVDMTWKAQFPAALDIALEIFKVIFDSTRESDIEEGSKEGVAEEFVTKTLDGLLSDWAEAIKPEKPAEESEADKANPASVIADASKTIPPQIADGEPNISDTISKLGFAIKEDEDVEALSAYYQKAKSLTRTYVKLLTEENTVQKMVTKITEQSIAGIEGKVLQTHTQCFA